MIAYKASKQIRRGTTIELEIIDVPFNVFLVNPDDIADFLLQCKKDRLYAVSLTEWEAKNNKKVLSDNIEIRMYDVQ